VAAAEGHDARPHHDVGLSLWVTRT
jgi:hypothetical protein